MRRLVVVSLLCVVLLPAAAQVSPSYTVKESVLNEGGHPTDGVVLASASFMVTLDSIGDGAVGSTLVAENYRVEVGFVGGFPPPGEVSGLGFSDRSTLCWTPEKSTGSYNMYRDPVSALPGRFGGCLQAGLTTECTTDAPSPPEGVAWFYLVTAENRLEEEGTLGSGSAGVERPNAAPCP